MTNDLAIRILNGEVLGTTEQTHEAVAMAVKALSALPSTDVQPVRHGKWIDMADFEQCSSCSGTRLKEMQTVYGKAIWIKTPYCPNCGARMDGE